MDGESFFRRWARRKAASEKASEKANARASARAAPPLDDVDAAAELQPLPTLEDVQRLTIDSDCADYAPFFARGADPVVRRAALKALFSDPHFNAMDGLDVYIGDYTKHAPLTPAMLAALQHARGLLAPADTQDELERTGDIDDKPEDKAEDKTEDSAPPAPDPQP